MNDEIMDIIASFALVVLVAGVVLFMAVGA